ncbi:MAG: gliding motility-associated C-terminal domain-containing protein [Bacteroidota bacterium]|nr:gliding motility-associated C-terminal domain-containing protein [Bacteroidota bacterium]MDP3147293.1 gliding motility-associated C-terminal domain-containing protein [Bacteroidota bacterium]
MKKIITTLILLSFFVGKSQTLMPIGPQNANFAGMVRGYHFTAPVAFNMCALYIPPDAPGAAGQLQHIRVVRFTAAAPPAFPGVTNAFVQLFSITNAGATTTVPCNIAVNAGDIIGIYGARAGNCINSYDGVNFATNILGNPTTCSRSGMQACIAAGGNMANIWSEVNFNIGRIFMYYNCCPTPTITIAPGSPSICAGTSVTVFGGGATTYTWMPGNINTASISLSPSVTTNYTLSGSTAGCTGSNTVAVTINPNPTVTANATNSVICLGGSTTLNGGGAVTYTWSGGITNGVAFSPTITTTYTVTGTSASGCINTAVKTISVLPNPIPLLNSNSPVCLGANLTFTASGGTINLTGPNGFASTATNPTIANVSALANGNYTLIVTAGTCTASTVSAVVINPLPLPIANSNSPVCLNQPINFTGSGGTTYTWTGPGAYTSNAQNPTIASAVLTNAGTYTLGVTNGNGCTNTITTNVVVNSLPIIITNSPTACVGSNINLTATGGTGYAWSGPLGYTSLVQNPTITNATGGMSGIYTVTVTSAAGCTASANASVTVINNPTATLISNSPVCIGSNLTFTASGGTINLTGPNGFASAATNPTLTNVTALAGGNYTLIVTAGTCTASTTSAVVINPLPVPIANSNSPVCLNQPINFTGSGGTTYTWTGPGAYSSNAQNPTIASAALTNAGTYTLGVTNANGCTNTITTNAVVNSLPVIVTNSPTACLNTNVNLTSNGGVGYAWSGPLGYTSLVQNPTFVGTSTSMSGIYTVTVTSAAGCTASANASVAVVNLPVAVLTSNSPVCLGGALTFTASGGTVNITGPNGFASSATNPTITNVSALAGGNYTLIVAAGTCTASTTSAVVINPLPVPIANSNSPVCLNQPINFTGSGGTTYTWTGPGAYTSNAQNPTIASAALTNAGTYTLGVTDVNSCTNTITTNVVVNSLPTIAPLSNPTVCLNTTINLAANGGVGYAWSGPLGFNSLVQNPSITNATSLMSGVYTVTVTSALGCTNTAVSTVTVLPLPTPAIVSNTPCVGTTLNLNGSGGSVYSWSGPNGFNSATQNPSITNVTLPANGNYTLVATVGTCSASVVQAITINSLPIPAAANNAPICETNNLVLTGNGGGNYSWMGPLGFTSAVQNPTITNALNTHSGNYILTVTDANGCQASATTAVTILANPSALANGATVCFGQPANLNASGGASYSWIGPNGFTSNIANPVIPSVNSSNTGNYTVTVTGVNTCTSVTAVNVSSNPLPVPTITSTAKTCLNTPVNLQGSTGFLMYQWTGPNNFISPNPNTGFTATSMSQNGLYVYSVTDNNGCTGSTSTLVVIDPLPVGTLVSDGKNSCVPFCANFSVTAGVGSSPIALTSWQLNNQTLVGSSINYCFINAGSYPVNASFTDNNGCSSSATFAINAYAAPRADFEFSPLKPVENIDNVEFTNTSTGLNNISWNWYFVNNNGYTSTSQNTNYMFQEAGSYPVAMIVQNKWGCIDTIVKTITIAEEQTLYVPNAFTPNGDGINDIFLPKGKGLVKYNLLVFDRWGEKVYETSDFSAGWDGAFKGIECKEDVYVWKITATFPQGKVKEYTGHVTLNR